MHQNQQSGIYNTTTNSLSDHASLLLSASPTIINSPLQTSAIRSSTNNNNNNSNEGNNLNQNNNNNTTNTNNNSSNNILINNMNADATDRPSSSRLLTGGSQRQQIQRDQLYLQQQQQNINSSSLRRQTSIGPLSASSQQQHSVNLDSNLDTINTTDTADNFNNSNTNSANLATDNPSSANSPLNDIPTESFIDFEKPQSEIFKKLDGKIQKIVAAHSNFNKLYALNDFSGLGVGPKRPFELPPQLPPPPPWVPKVQQSDCYSVSQWAQDSSAEANRSEFRPCSSNSSSSTQELNSSYQQQQQPSRPATSGPSIMMSTPKTTNTNRGGALPKIASLTIDSAISRLHQRRLQQQQQQQEQQQSIQQQHLQHPQEQHLQPQPAHILQHPSQQRQLPHQPQQLTQDRLLQQIRQRNRHHQLLMQRQQRQQLILQNRIRQQQQQQQMLASTSPNKRRINQQQLEQQLSLARRSDMAQANSSSAQILDGSGSRPVSVRSFLNSANSGIGNNSMDATRNTPTITSAQFNLLAQKIKETLETECANKNQAGTLSSEDKKKFQENLIALLKQEITAVAKSANLKFNSPPTDQQPRPVGSNPLNLKSSPQALFNTIRRETSLLLSRRDKQVSNQRATDPRNNRSNDTELSLLSDQQRSRQQSSHNIHNILRQSLPPRSHENSLGLRTSPFKLPINRLQQTVKVVIPPTDYYQNPGAAQSRLSSEKKEESENLISNVKTESSKDGGTANKRSPLTYQVIRRKLKAFQENNQICLGKSSVNLFAHSISQNESGGLLKNKKLAQKSLDKIVDRLQARCSGTMSEMEPARKPGSISLQQRIINSSADLLRAAASGRNQQPTALPSTPIPVFRSAFTTQKGDWVYHGAQDSRMIKSKKTKRHHSFGLKIANYVERECPQPGNDRITVDQFAKCLNLVRPNDISIRRHREQLESEVKWRLPVSNRPLRLRRIRGERLPPSASYKATRKAGLK